MKKSTLLIAVASAILAFAIPSTATATQATCPAGTNCPVGTEVSATGANVGLQTQFVGNLSCSRLVLKATIQRNSGGAAGEVVAGGHHELSPEQEKCYVNGETSKPIIVTAIELTNLTAHETTGSAGAIRYATLTFDAEIRLPSAAVCKFTATSVPVRFISGQSPAVLTSTDPMKDIPSTGGCGKAQLTGEFTLEKTSNPNEKIVLD